MNEVVDTMRRLYNTPWRPTRRGGAEGRGAGLPSARPACSTLAWDGTPGPGKGTDKPQTHVQSTEDAPVPER